MIRRFQSQPEQRAALYSALERHHPTFRTGGDLYRDEIRKVVRPGVIVLDAGCGHGGIITEFRDQIGKLFGVDVAAEDVRRFTILDQGIVSDLASIPLPDSSVDVITGEFVLEHLQHPLAVFQELRRVLRSNGTMIFLTPNIRHPVMAMARITPTMFHRWWKGSVLKSHAGAQPTYYRANTPQAIRTLAIKTGLRLERLELAGNPEYLAINQTLMKPAIKLEKYLATRQPERQMYIVIVLKKT